LALAHWMACSPLAHRRVSTLCHRRDQPMISVSGPAGLNRLNSNVTADSSAHVPLLRRNRIAIAGIAALALGVLALQALLHSHYSAVDEYDDGVYFGASVELIHGVIAYRDFAFIQPPMITLWMVPFAALSTLTGTAVAMEMARFFVDLVTVTNVVLVGVLVRRRTTRQVVLATGVMAFSQGTIRSSQTILLEPFLVLACLIAFLFLLNGEKVTTSYRRLWWCGVFFGIAGATKVWAVLPLAAALIVLSSRGARELRKVVGGAIIGFGCCTLPFIVGAPAVFFQQVILTQVIRNGGGFSFLQRLADLTGIPGLSSLAGTHEVLGGVLVVAVLCAGLGAVVLCWRFRPVQSWSSLERLAVWGGAFVAFGLLTSSTYYYHYSGLMAPFLALIASSLVVRVMDLLCQLFPLRSRFLPGMLALCAAPMAIALFLGATVVEILALPVAPHVGDAVADAIPVHGCVLYANPALALLDDRFTSDVNGCPGVIDWLGQERVLDKGDSAMPSDTDDKELQSLMGRWIESSDAVVLEKSNLGLDSVNVAYLDSHFDRETDVPRGLRIFVREYQPRRHPPRDPRPSHASRSWAWSAKMLAVGTFPGGA
jgi:Glycosyltransferase family 87